MGRLRGHRSLVELTRAVDASRERACHPLRVTERTGEVPVLPSLFALSRSVAVSAAVAGLCGLVVGAIVFDGVSVAARLVFGGLFGLVAGAVIGAASGLTGALVAASTRLSGSRDAISQRVAFVLAGTGTALALSWWVLPPMSLQARLLLLVPLAAVTVFAGTLIGRRYIP